MIFFNFCARKKLLPTLFLLKKSLFCPCSKWCTKLVQPTFDVLLARPEAASEDKGFLGSLRWPLSFLDGTGMLVAKFRRDLGAFRIGFKLVLQTRPSTWRQTLEALNFVDGEKFANKSYLEVDKKI